MTSTASPSISSCDSAHSSPKRSIGQLALVAPRGVDEVLEAVHRDLAEDRRDRALDRLRQQRQPRLGRRRRLQQPPEHERLAEHRRGLGQRQRRRHVEDALLAAERGVHAVAELVRQRQHVAAQVRVVEQHVRVHARHARRSRTRRRACRAAPARRSSARRRSAARARRARARTTRRSRARVCLASRPPDLLVVLRDRRHAVVVGEPVDARAAAPSAGTSGAAARSAPRTASISACTDSSEASLERLRRRQPVRVVRAAGRRSSCRPAAC